MAVFFLSAVFFSLAGCAPPKEKIAWADDKDLILQAMQDASESQRLSKSNLELLNQRMLRLEQTVAQQAADVAALTATLKEQKLQRIQWEKIQEKKAAPVLKAVEKKVVPRAAVVAPPPPVFKPVLMNKIKKIEEDMPVAVASPNSRDNDLHKKSKEKDLYTASYLSLKSGRYDEAIASFQELLRTFPQGEYVDQGSYWLGESYLAKGKFDDAIEAFSDVVQNHKQSAKYQPSLLKLAMAYQEKGRVGDARAVLQRLIDEAPESRAAERARLQLAGLTESQP